jgi:hypothetical protein
MESLVRSLDRFDFAVSVIRADDIIYSQGVSSQTARDNVIFELGLVTGRFGRSRSFILQSSSQTLKVPSDLLGVNPGEYDEARPDGDMIAAVGPACTLIRNKIRELGLRAKLEPLVSNYQMVMRDEKGLVRFWAYRKLQHSSDDIARLVTGGEFEYNEHEHHIVMGHLYGNAKSGDWIHAVSIDEIRDWEEPFLGGKYSDLNARAAAAGATVERVFIYRDLLELRTLVPFIVRQKSEGIEVFVAVATQLNPRRRELENRLIIKIQEQPVYTIFPWHGPDGNLINAVVSWDRRKADEFELIYQRVKAMSRAWSDILKNELLPETR